ncbi:phospholipase D family protein [Verrucosispora sp. TAA-831]|uniref:phospholipase D family protein n=1 Tax=Verrucosispora sp. TAA-831 TaxID=3422227 RepID=UPI003D6E38DC
MRYLDTGSRDANQTVHRWLAEVLPDATLFACQTGYFGRDGLDEFETDFRALLDRGGEFHLVVGSNDGGLRSADLRHVAELIDGRGPGCTLHVVGASDVLMHPKTYYVETRSGVKHALVGSANLTLRGITANVEAALAIDSVGDPDAPFDQILEAILAWGSGTRPNSIKVNLSNIDDLVSAGAVDLLAPAPPNATPAESERRKKLFPALGTMVASSGRRKKGGSSAPNVMPTPDGEATDEPEEVASSWGLPGGSIGIVKRLTSLDTKAFRGERGTPHIALPRDLAAFLPMSPYGRNGEPRINVHVAAYLDTLPGTTFLHEPSRSETNITYVGMGVVVKSHRDLRFNYLKPITNGIVDAAARARVPVPSEGDIAAVLFDDAQAVRLVFVTQEPLLRELAALVTESNGVWGWLPAALATRLP